MWHLPLLLLLVFWIQPYIHQWNSAIAYGLFWLWALLVIVPFASMSFLLVEKPWMQKAESLGGGYRKKSEEA
jgi:peptidoglycan/LPS O-acetylase OafA/YrhL